MNKHELQAQNEQLRVALEAMYNAYFGRETTEERWRASALARSALGSER